MATLIRNLRLIAGNRKFRIEAFISVIKVVFALGELDKQAERVF
jgi:hypothetical protein